MELTYSVYVWYIHCMKNSAFKSVCRFLGSQKKTAEILGVTPGMVTNVVKGRRPMPPAWAPVLEEATSGTFTCEKLAPSIKWSVVANRKKDE